MFLNNILSTAIKTAAISNNCRTLLLTLSKQNINKKQYSISGEPKMAENLYTGLLLSTILEGLENFAPLSLAESWDNVGLLVDPMDNAPIKKILLTNDLTEEVVDEAVGLKAGLIISYHPNIFQGLKAVSARTWKERIVIQCIKNNIAVFSPHTSWDCAKGGVNDWLGNAFANQNSSAPIIPKSDNPIFGPGRLITLKSNVTLKQAVELIKQHTNLPHLRLAMGKGQNQESQIKTIALCAGSGASVLKGIQADLYLTGEMLHHDILDAAQNGVNVILCNHSDSERGFLKHFKQQLQTDILSNKAEVFVSKVDCDPLTTV